MNNTIKEVKNNVLVLKIIFQITNIFKDSKEDHHAQIN